MNDLKKIIEMGTAEVEQYLAEVSPRQFMVDVKDLMKRFADKQSIAEAIKRLEELL